MTDLTLVQRCRDVIDGYDGSVLNLMSATDELSLLMDYSESDFQDEIIIAAYRRIANPDIYTLVNLFD